MTKQFKTGDVVEIKLDGRPYKTVIDAHGTQRFVANEAVVRFIDAGRDPVTSNFKPGHYSLNDLAFDFQNGKVSLQDYLEFNMMSGYSVCGLMDMHAFSSLPIENPCWD